MTRSIILGTLLLLAMVRCSAQDGNFPELRGPYFGQKPPGDTARPFAPAFFGSRFTSFHSGIVFAPDGNAAYWQAMLNDESKGQAIFESRIEKGVWTKPRVAPFSGLVKGGRDDSPVISPDGKRLYFLSSRPVAEGGDAGIERIWVAKKTGEGWSEPVLVPLSWNPADGRIHWRFSVDGKGNLYFGAWKIRGEEVTGGIFQSRFANGQYSAPEKLGLEINREGYYNFCPSVAPDGSYLIFTRVGPKASDRHPDNIFCSFRDKDGTWSNAQKLQIPGDTGNDVPAISSDGKYLFMRHGLNQFYWLETSFIEALRPKLGSTLIWYLGHCGFAVRTAQHLLIFDYQERRDGQQPKSRPAKPSLENGWINPDEIRNLPVRVFASHSHDDHYDPVILDWKKKIPDIQYFFGWKAGDDTSAHYLVGPRGEYFSSDLKIATINSHHSGVPEVAWLVSVDGVVVYHNGDCQPDDAASEYEFLKKKTERIDIAFVPPVHEERLKYATQNMVLFREFSPRLVLPMHVTAGGAMYKDFEKAWKSKIPGLSVALPEKLGERFVLERSR